MAVFRMKLLILMLTILVLPGCTAMLLGNNSSGEPVSTNGTAASQSSSDSRISATIRQQYAGDAEIRDFALGIRTVSGRVTLTGTVGGYDVRDRVVEIAKNTRGVISVDSRVVVNTNL